MEEEVGQVNKGWIRLEEDFGFYLQCPGKVLSEGVAYSSFALEWAVGMGRLC